MRQLFLIYWLKLVRASLSSCVVAEEPYLRTHQWRKSPDPELAEDCLSPVITIEGVYGETKDGGRKWRI